MGVINSKLQKIVLVIESRLNNSKSSNTFHFNLLARASHSLTLFDLLAQKKRISFAQFIMLCIINFNPKIPAYAQKVNWARVEKLQALPRHRTHGSLFLSIQGPPNWD
jgi:hypothetical protein